MIIVLIENYFDDSDSRQNLLSTEVQLGHS
jgi:hypothetical protein